MLHPLISLHRQDIRKKAHHGETAPKKEHPGQEVSLSGLHVLIAVDIEQLKELLGRMLASQ